MSSALISSTMVSYSEKQALLRRGSGSKSKLKRNVTEKNSDEESGEPNSVDEDIPFSGRVYLARKKAPLTRFMKWFELFLVIFSVVAVYVMYYYLDHVAFHVTHAYAKYGDTHAKHRVAQHYLQGKGVSENPQKAMHWFKQAADDGHPEAAFNLAVGHLKGHIQLNKGEAHNLIHKAAVRGVQEAHDMLNKVCTRKGSCD